MKRFAVFFLMICTYQSAFAFNNRQYECLSGQPPQSTDLQIDKISVSLHWGIDGKCLYKGEMKLQGKTFKNETETIQVFGCPHYHQFIIVGDGLISQYRIDTSWKSFDDVVGTIYSSQFSMNLKEGWKRSIPLVCTLTKLEYGKDEHHIRALNAQNY